MRSIGSLTDEKLANQFGDFLTVEGIENEVEHDEEAGEFLIWIHDDEQLALGSAHLEAFRADPGAEQFRGVEGKAEKLRRAKEKDNERAAKRMHSRKDTLEAFGAGARAQQIPVTMTLIGLCIATTLLFFMNKGSLAEILGWWDFRQVTLKFEIWRLITPVFPHLGVMHLLFNMYWLWEFGGQIEHKRGRVFFLLLCFVSGVLSLVAEIVVGEITGVPRSPLGFSGVGYGLFGFIAYKWFLGKGNYRMSELLVAFFIGWMLLGFGGVIQKLFGINMANWAHLGGLVAGVVFAMADTAVRQLRK